MAIVKTRIMSRSQVMQAIAGRGRDPAYTPDRPTVELSATAYMIADGVDVKVYNDVNMGGMVVEYNDGN